MTFPAVPPLIDESPLRLTKSNIAYELRCVEADEVWHASVPNDVQAEIRRIDGGYSVFTAGYISVTPTKHVATWTDVEQALFES